MTAVPLGLYLHVPFCATACSFCAFYQERPRREALDAYLEAMEIELGSLRLPRHVETVFWGGGTPGLLPAADLERLGRAMLEALGNQPDEWTVEMAPSVVRADKLEVLKALGVTRLSMGVQTFKPQLLAALGRRHGPNQVYEAYQAMRAAGFENINLDLMFALPGQSFEAWLTDLDQAIALNPEHISTYCLTFEEDTALYAKLMRGETHRRSLEEEANFYLRTWEHLAKAGYEQYEVSNFSKPGRACQHNLDTWHMAEWIGVGPSAASQFGGYRYRNLASIDNWRAGILKGAPVHEDVTEVTPQLLAVDSLIFGLRLNSGISWRLLLEKYDFLQKRQASYAKLWVELIDAGLMEQHGDFLKLTDQGRLVADAIAERCI